MNVKPLLRSPDWLRGGASGKGEAGLDTGIGIPPGAFPQRWGSFDPELRLGEWRTRCPADEGLHRGRLGEAWHPAESSWSAQPQRG